MQAYQSSFGGNVQTRTFGRSSSLRPRGETDITRSFELRILGSTPGEGTKGIHCRTALGTLNRTRNGMLYSMRKDKEIAIELRRSGKSYKQIRAELKIPLGTLSDWFREIDWSKELTKRLSQDQIKTSTKRILELNKVRGRNLERVYEEARKEAREEFEQLKYHPLFIAGLMLYWGEGVKRRKYGTKLANTDPELIRLFVHFLQKVCGVPREKIKAQVLVYPDLEEKTCRAYWTKWSGIPWENFIKSTVIQGRHPTKRLNWGVCTVMVSSTYFKAKLLEWLRLLPGELIRRDYYENIRSEAGIV